MKVEKRLVLMLILSAALSTMFLASLTGTAKAQGTAQMVLNPTYVYYPSTDVLPSTLVFDINVINVTNLGAWQVTIAWNQSVLNFVNISLPTDNVFAGQSPIIGLDTSTPGQITYGATAGVSQPGFNGTGILAQMILAPAAMLAAPASSIFEFKGIQSIPADTFLFGLDLVDIPFTATDGWFGYGVGTSVTHTISGSNSPVMTASNGTIQPNSAVIDPVGKTISFNVTGNTGNAAFLYADLPKKVINVTGNDIARWNVSLNGANVKPQITQNDTDTFMFAIITFASDVTVSVKGDNIIPELSSMLIILIIASSATVAIAKSRTRRK
jgi:hypothetical protein